MYLEAVSRDAMIRLFLALSTLLRPEDEALSRRAKDRVQLYRLMTLLGAFLITSLSLLYRISFPESVSPEWAYLGLSGLFGGLFAASYVSREVRRRYVLLTWGLLYIQMVWITAVAMVNRFGNEHAIAVLLVYASIGVVIELGAQSFRPILWFLGSGFLLTAGALFLTTAPQSEPSVLLGIMAVTALTIGFSLQGRLSIRRKLTDRERRLDERRRKIKSLFEATSRLLEARTRSSVSDRIHDVLQEIFDYPLNSTGFLEDKRIVPEGRTTDETIQVPAPTAQPFSEDTVSTRTLRAEETVVVEDLKTLDNDGEDEDGDYGELSSAAGVPIGEQGVIVLGQVDDEDFERFNLRLIEMLASYAALVLDRLDREEELRDAKTEAEEAAQLKSAMLANMSHELRTPLTSITGFSEMLEENLNGDLEVFATQINQSSQRLMSTLDSVLHLSKLEAGVHELEREEFSLEETVEDVVEMSRRRAEEKSLTLATDSPGGPVVGRWNRDAVFRICRNLVDNAIKFTPEGGRVDVRAEATNQGAILQVEDTGIGMEPDHVMGLFEAFQQESEGLGREYEGSGLGLSIVKRLTEELKGSIEVETEKGTGTCFTIRFPKTPGQAAGDDSRVEESCVSLP